MCEHYLRHGSRNPIVFQGEKMYQVTFDSKPLQTLGDSDSSNDRIDAFDVCDAPPTAMFVNPFATNANPLLWAEMQAVAEGTPDPLEALRGAGVVASESAVCYLTSQQRDMLVQELERMCASWAVDAAAFYVADCLARARVTNARVQ